MVQSTASLPHTQSLRHVGTVEALSIYLPPFPYRAPFLSPFPPIIPKHNSHSPPCRQHPSTAAQTSPLSPTIPPINQPCLTLIGPACRLGRPHICSTCLHHARQSPSSSKTKNKHNLSHQTSPHPLRLHQKPSASPRAPQNWPLAPSPHRKPGHYITLKTTRSAATPATAADYATSAITCRRTCASSSASTVANCAAPSPTRRASGCALNSVPTTS